MIYGNIWNGIEEKARQIMAPATPKSEGYMADAIERWLEGLRILSGHKLQINGHGLEDLNGWPGERSM